MSRESRHDTLLKMRQTHAAGVDAVAQPASEARLFQHACDVILWAGLSRLAWFGYASGSERRIGEPAAFALSHPDDADRVVDRRQAVLACGTPVDLEVRMRRFFLFRANPLRGRPRLLLSYPRGVASSG